MRRATRRAFLVGLCLLCLGILIVPLLMGLLDDPPDILFLPANEAFKPPSALKQLGLKLRSVVLRRRTIMIRAEIVSTDKIASGEKLADVLGRALGETNRLWVWTVDQEDVSRFEKSLGGALRKEDLIANPTIGSLDSTQGSMFVGNSAVIDGTNVSVGLDLRVLPRRREHALDLTVSYSSTELTSDEGTNANAKPLLVTNANFAVRVQVPKGKRLFIMSETPGKTPTCIFFWSISR